MVTFTDILGLVPTLRERLGEGSSAASLRMVIAGMTDAEVLAILDETTELVNTAEQVRLIASGVAATRSTRDAGHTGIAQTRGHRNIVSLIQDITGVGRAEAARTVRVGEALVADTGAPDSGMPTGAGAGNDLLSDGGADVGMSRTPWHTPLDCALLDGTINAAQHDAIRGGLGEPPLPEQGTAPEVEAAVCAVREAVIEAWSLAATGLVTEAACRTVEELRQTARTIRDRLDPEGAAVRFHERFERRSFRMWTDADGVHRGSFSFDDEAALWVRTIIDSALRPRRGGPRFVDPDEAARAEEIREDPRGNDQLAYDLMIDVLRAGALADAETVFGTRQAGVRLVRVIDADEHDTEGSPLCVALSEDGLLAFPTAVAEQHACAAGARQVTIDPLGNPLDVGREQRLFTPRQRIALALRDGGCRWRGCDRPASYCEAHHIDPYAEGGRTDIDRGILLCRFHHMNLHHHRWRITRDGKGDFVLHDPGGESTILPPRLALTYAWAGIDPPPRRFLPAAA